MCTSDGDVCRMKADTAATDNAGRTALHQAAIGNHGQVSVS